MGFAKTAPRQTRRGWFREKTGKRCLGLLGITGFICRQFQSFTSNPLPKVEDRAIFAVRLKNGALEAKFGV
jgi:hypothetical protein